MKSRKELKQIARDNILQAMVNAVYHLNDDSSLNEDEKGIAYAYLNEEFKRLEKRYGYIEGSWLRG